MIIIRESNKITLNPRPLDVSDVFGYFLDIFRMFLGRGVCEKVRILCRITRRH